MKAVMLSIRPEWCAKIASGKKTIEVRKTKPKLDPPFKCYIYCTNDKRLHFWKNAIYSYADDRSHNAYDISGNGKVIGEFICDQIITTTPWRLKGHTGRCAPPTSQESIFETCSCLTMKDIEKYAGWETHILYGWHISKLKLYEQPKELSKFYSWKKCNACREGGYEIAACACDEDCKVPAMITRPPQSWCYAEEE